MTLNEFYENELNLKLYIIFLFLICLNFIYSFYIKYLYKKGSRDIWKYLFASPSSSSLVRSIVT